MSDIGVSSAAVLNDPTPLRLQLEKARSFLEPCWREWWGDKVHATHTNSCGMCWFTSQFLIRFLKKELSQTWSLASYLEMIPGNGILDTHGMWQTHCWLEHDGVIIDITADQFGHDSIIITTVTDPRYGRVLEDSPWTTEGPWAIVNQWWDFYTLGRSSITITEIDKTTLRVT